MSKKLVTLNGKTYLMDTETKELEEVKEEGAPAAEETPKEEAGEAELDAAAEKVAKSLGLGEIQTTLKDIQAKLAAKDKVEEKEVSKKVSALLDLESLMKKSVDQMTPKEKIVGFYQALIQSNRTVIKALSEGTAADGGYLFPDEFRAEIIRDLADGNFMRNEVTVVPMKRDMMKIPALESRPTVTWTEENATKSTTTASFDERTLTVKKMAAILYASDELVEDSTEIDIVQFIIGLFSEVIGEGEDAAIWQGNGTTQPTGVSTARAAGTIATRTATAGLTIDALIDLIYDLPGKYHKGAKFWVHRHMIREMRKLQDSNGRKYWSEPVAVGQPATFYGYPVIEVNDIPEKEIYFGDMRKAYWLGDRGKMTAKVSQDTETAFTKDQTAIRVVERIAGNVVLGKAMKCLNGI